jgi:hypothetical protein
MYQRTSIRMAVVAAAVAGLGLAVTAAAPTQAAAAKPAAPKFLAAKELPPHPGSAWYAGGITKGLPEFDVFCLDGVLPQKGASHRQFWTEYDTGAIQLVVKAASNKSARALAAKAEKSIRNCATDFMREYPEGEADWQNYGKLKVENGAHVYGVHTAVPDSEHGVHLFGVGRDGRTVTVVRWGEMGTLDQAPVKAFKKTTRTAVAKLYR